MALLELHAEELSRAVEARTHSTDRDLKDLGDRRGCVVTPVVELEDRLVLERDLSERSEESVFALALSDDLTRGREERRQRHLVGIDGPPSASDRPYMLAEAVVGDADGEGGQAALGLVACQGPAEEALEGLADDLVRGLVVDLVAEEAGEHGVKSLREECLGFWIARAAPLPESNVLVSV